MPRNMLERKSITKTVRNISSLANHQGAIARKPEGYDKSLALYRHHLIERTDLNDRSLWDNGCDSVIDLQRIYYQPPACHSREPHKVPSKQVREKKKEKKKKKKVDGTTDKKLTESMKNLFLDTKKLPIGKAITPKPNDKRNFNLARYVQRNLVAWSEQVFAKVGPDQKERKYQDALTELLLSKGCDVASEQPLTLKRAGSKDIIKRADLIISKQRVTGRVLLELKAKKKLQKKDFEQILDYQDHFNTSECYLINFWDGAKVLKWQSKAITKNDSSVPPIQTSRPPHRIESVTYRPSEKQISALAMDIH